MVGWHHQFNQHELGQTPGHGEGQGSLTCCSPWGHKELDTAWQLNNNKVHILCGSLTTHRYHLIVKVFPELNF